MSKFEFVFGMVGIVLLAAILWALPTILLWNWLMPDLFHLPKIGFLQACGINLLTGILFKSSTVTQSNNSK